jgi:adenosylmethionine-8-amino-7-oxononanoate aminotransferase
MLPADRDHDDLERAAREHLLLHFARNARPGEAPAPLLVLERGDGPYVFDTQGRRHIDALSSLFCSQLGYSYGAEMAEAASAQLQRLAFNTNWGTAHPPAIELAERLAGLAPGACSTPSSPTAARSRSRRPGRSCASTTSRAASRAARRRSPATSPTTA